MPKSQLSVIISKMPKTDYKYKFAFLFDQLTPLYDLGRILGIRNRLQRRLWPQVEIKPGSRVLDVGCGTGDDLIYLASHYRGLFLTGVDGDPKVLAMAKNKANNKNLIINFQVSLAEKLPFSQNSFDVIWSSLMIHHLPTPIKLKTLKEMRRVLKPGGQLYLIDFDLIKNRLVRSFYWLQTLLEPVGDHFSGKLPEYLRAAGFKRLARMPLLFHVSLYQGVK